MTTQTKHKNVLVRLGLAAAITVGACLGMASPPVAALTYIPKPLGPEVNVLQSCVGKRDRIDVLLVNTQSVFVSYTAELVPAVTGTGPFDRKVRTINVAEHKQVSLWLPEAAIDEAVLVVRRGDVEIYRQPARRYCATGSIAPNVPEVSVTNACRKSGGFVRVSVVNSSKSRQVWTVKLTDVTEPITRPVSRRLAVPARGSRSVIVGQRTPGNYLVEWYRDGREVDGMHISVECGETLD